MTSSHRPAQAAEIERLPEHVVGEVFNGALHVSPRPASRLVHTSSALGGVLFALRPRRDGPFAGWWIYDEPELHFADDVLVPDLAGWRVERMPTVPDVAAFTLTPRQGVRGAAALDPADRPREEVAPVRAPRLATAGSLISSCAWWRCSRSWSSC